MTTEKTVSLFRSIVLSCIRHLVTGILHLTSIRIPGQKYQEKVTPYYKKD